MNYSFNHPLSQRTKPHMRDILKKPATIPVSMNQQTIKPSKFAYLPLAVIVWVIDYVISVLFHASHIFFPPWNMTMEIQSLTKTYRNCSSVGKSSWWSAKNSLPFHDQQREDPVSILFQYVADQ